MDKGGGEVGGRATLYERGHGLGISRLSHVDGCRTCHVRFCLFQMRECR